MVIIPRPIVFLLLTYLSGIVVFFLFRVILLLLNAEAAQEIPPGEILYSQFMGYRFDTVISGYILALPMALFLLSGLIPSAQNSIRQISFVWICFFYLASFFICTADIPYFLHFNSRMTIAVMNWTDTPAMMMKIVFQDSGNYPYLFLFLSLSIMFLILLSKIKKHSFSKEQSNSMNRVPRAVLYLATSLMLLTGIRGRIAIKSPIRWGTAFFSQRAFANQLGLNPVFTFGRSWLDSRKPENAHIKLMDEEQAAQNMRKYLGIESKPELYSPLAREISSDAGEKRYNVVLIIMESMSAWKMGILGSRNNLTPNLDSIAGNSFFFSNFYSSGMHTFSGIYSSLFGMPGLPGKHAMKDLESNQPFSGIAKTLSDRNYGTIFFCTHDEQFDNMGGFLSANGFKKIVSEKDYPSERVLSTLGVPDHVMFDISLPYLDNFRQNDQPFFAAYLTGSDHGPYIIPDDIPFHPEANNIRQKIVEYTDWSVNHFIEECHKRPWADSTIFIITSDHGNLANAVYDADLSLTRTFLIIHAPKIFREPKKVETLGGQIDIFPTLMGLLDISYINNTPGINLLKEERPFIFFCVDENTGCVSDEYYLVMRKNGDTSLYRYRERDTKNYLSEKQSLADSMKTYTKSNLQIVQQMILRRIVY
ncbi:MAG TPA: sulfatase-like hydrolase/transferase [Bacteroidia bacterium]|nr:sulfatase-like hydrolase/transferase [Bacteroidia bacterium]